MADNTPGDFKLESLREEIQNYFGHFLSFLLRGENVPKNILLVGLPSAGKSSFINLLKSTLVGHYVEIAQPGASYDGDLDQFTQRLTRYENMGLTEREVANLVHGMRAAGINVPKNFRLPTLIDIPGIEHDSELVLDLVLDGLIPEHADLCLPKGLKCLPDIDYRQQMENCIDQIVFVASLKQDVPEQLIKTVFKLGYQERGIPYTLVMTHNDCRKVLGNTANGRKKRMENILCITKDSRGVMHCLTNYCDLDPADPERPHAYRVNYRKHKDALIAMLNMVRPRQLRVPCRKRSGILARFAKKTIRFAERNDILIKFVVFAVLVVILAVIVSRYIISKEISSYISRQEESRKIIYIREEERLQRRGRSPWNFNLGDLYSLIKKRILYFLI